MEPGDFALSFTVLHSGFDVLALVAFGFALTDAEFDLHVAAFPVTAKSDNGLALLLSGRPELHDLALVKQQPADGLGFVLLVTGLFVRLDVAAEEEALKAINAREGVVDIDVAQPDGFDLRAF